MRLEEIVAECNVGKIIDSTQKSVSREEVDAFLKIIKKANFWQLTSSVEDAGLDGSDWVVEGLDRGNYHLVDRWSPTSGGVREIGVFLLNLAGFTKEEIY